MLPLGAICIALVAFAAAKPTREFNKSTICDTETCTCFSDIHPSWTTVQCNLYDGTRLDLMQYELPKTVTELVIYGGEAVMFGSGVFNDIADLRQITVTETKIVVFHQYAAVGISVLTLNLDIEKCNILRFQKNAFLNLRGPMSVNISHCDAVSVEGDTFSWLLYVEVSNVRDLNLASGSFSLDPTAANVGDHGPGMTVELKNTSISEIPKSTFGSSAAKVNFESVDIHAIRNGAFSANTYNIVIALNCTIHLIEDEAFSENSLINYLSLTGCKIQQMASKAFRSAIADININRTRFDHVETGAINTTVAKVKILGCEFHTFMERALEMTSWNYLQMENNSFDELPPNAIIAAPAASNHKLLFRNNEIETMHPQSLSFIGKAANTEMEYLNNYFGQTCHCNISHWLAQALDVNDGEPFTMQSYCTVNEVIARCFNVPDQNMVIKKFLQEVCTETSTILCEQLKTKAEGEVLIKNTRFPHKNKKEELSARNKKVIGIVLVSCLGCVLIAILFSLYKWWRRGVRGCAGIKAIFNSFNTTCISTCANVCECGSNAGIDSASTHSISQLNVSGFSERHRLNETRALDTDTETHFDEEVAILTENKTTQTLPEELTKELLENLKERLDNPENYVEAKEMIEHLYELTKISNETPQANPTFSGSYTENIYESPNEFLTKRTNPNNRKMISTGTRVPSLDKLMPLSPYYGRTALSRQYYEPHDLAVHLYAEIANNSQNQMPDVIAEPACSPRLRLVLSPTNSTSSQFTESTSLSPISYTSKSDSSSSSGKMKHRPLPEKPQGECVRDNSGKGPSLRLG